MIICKVASGFFSVFCVGAFLIGLGTPSQAICQTTDNSISSNRLLTLGKQIFRQGKGSRMQSINAIVQGDIPIDGSQMACVNCHRRSGLGTSESGIIMLPVTSEFIFRPKEVGRRKKYGFRSEGTGTRPAYNDQSLKTAIRDGVDPTGRALNPLMPRYKLSNEELDALVKYLKSLSSSSSPGVSETVIHFSTIIAENIDPGKKKAMLDVIETYFQGLNAGTRHETKRAKNAPWHRDWKYQAYRKWVLDVWELKGPKDSWPSQLETYYRNQPVFAILSGIINSRWDSIHRFCEQHEIPCLFPNTDVPVVSENGYYSFYFSKGLTLEATALAKHIVAEQKGGKIVQLYRRNQDSEISANALSTALSKSDRFTIENEVIGSNQDLSVTLGKVLSAHDGVLSWVFWLNDSDLETITPILQKSAQPGRLYFSSSLAPTAIELSLGKIQDRVYLIHPFEHPNKLPQLLRQSRTWLQVKKIQSKHQRIQSNTFFTVSIAGRAIRHMRDKFSREYFVEIIEHSTEKSLLKSIYPRLSLGPGQRYASKGVYIIKLLRPEAETRFEGGQWVLP